MTTFKYSGDGIEQLIASYKKDRHPFTVQDNLIFPDVEPLILELKHTLRFKGMAQTVDFGFCQGYSWLCEKGRVAKQKSPSQKRRA